SGFGGIPTGGRPPESAVKVAAGQPIKIETSVQLPGVHAPQADPQRKAYAIITGLVPVEKEMEEYRRRFEFAVRPVVDPTRAPAAMTQPGQTELPHYFCFFVERAEVTDPKNNNLKWAPILSKAHYLDSESIKDIPHWAVPTPEIVQPEYVFVPEPVKD